MFASQHYELLDFGNGRKLERFGSHVLDRVAPAADNAVPRNADLWKSAAARFERATRGGGGEVTGTWQAVSDKLPETWTIQHDGIVFELKLTPFGHVGLFAEQAANWDWLTSKLSAVAAERPRFLNLFAHTGGSTLTAAAAGADVVHVDSARNVVGWARNNARLSGLAAAPIRWIAEDAVKFAVRETRRGNRYDAVILDPPSFGRGPKGQVWKLDRDLPRLLTTAGQLLVERPRLLLLTCHSPGWTAARARDAVLSAIPQLPARRVVAQPLRIPTPDGDRRLSAGIAVRFAAS